MSQKSNNHTLMELIVNLSRQITALEVRIVKMIRITHKKIILRMSRKTKMNKKCPKQSIPMLNQNKSELKT